MTVEGVDSKPLGPGSWVEIAAMSVHAARCTAGAECEIFLEQAGPMDMKPAK